MLNQIYDLEIDRVNKPRRPLVTAAVGMRQAWIGTVILYLLAIIPTWLVVVFPYNGVAAKFFAPLPYHECFFIYIAGMIFTFIYSAPAFGRTKRFGIWANLTIAIPRGTLLKVAGWSMVAHVFSTEPWFIGGIFGLFILGAASTKDYSDIEGDRRGGCQTLPIRYGVRRFRMDDRSLLRLPVDSDADRRSRHRSVPRGSGAPDPHRQRDAAHRSRNHPRAVGELHRLAPVARIPTSSPRPRTIPHGVTCT